MNRLEDVDVEGVHLVGSPANQRNFAIIKAKGSKLSTILAGKLSGLVQSGRRTREEVVQAIADKAGASISAINAALRGSSSRPNENTLTAFASILSVSIGELQTAAGVTKQSEGDQTVKIAELLKAAGLTIGKNPSEETLKALEGEVTVEKMIEAIGKGELAKALGVKLEPEEKPIDKSKLSPEAKEYIEGLEKKVDGAIEDLAAIHKAKTEAIEKDLATRVAFLKSAGIDVPEKVSEAVVEALEKANQAFQTRLEKAGIFKTKGDARTDENTVGAAVAKEVVRRLGRQPIDKLEDAETRRQIYKVNPGLLKAMTAEERAARAG